MENVEHTKYMRELRRLIVKHFNIDELEILVADLGINKDELSGDILSKKTFSLITYLSKRGALNSLIKILREERPNVAWAEIPIPSAEHQIKHAEEIDILPVIKDVQCPWCGQVIRVMIPHIPERHFSGRKPVCPLCRVFFYIWRYPNGVYEITKLPRRKPNTGIPYSCPD